METCDVCNTTFDAELKKIDHYQKYPVMLPFIGKKYGEMPCKRCLIVAESFKFPHYVGADDWYAGYSGYREHSCYIDSRHIVGSYLSIHCPRQNPDGQKKGCKGDNHQIYQRLAGKMHDAGMPRGENPFAYVAYMNYFQRPAKGRFISESKDDEISSEVLYRVLSIIKPEAIVFVSCKAWQSALKSARLANELNRSQNEVATHPCCKWWNKPSTRGNGKCLFMKFFSDHVMLQPITA